MTMVKLKMKGIYKSFLSFIGFLILMLMVIGILYLFYYKVIDKGADIEVNGNLSINYIDGKSINVEDKNAIKFSITNSGNEVNYYNIGFLKVRGSGDYKILYNDEIVTEGKLSSVDEITTDFMSIDAGETKLYILEINNNDNNPLKAELNIRVQEEKNISFADVILKNTSVSEDSLTKVGYDVATEDEGLIKSSDDIGTSYYFRGKVENNYVSFGGMLWRIVRINGDGTVRLVLNKTTDVISNYYTSSNVVYKFEESNINSYLESWLQENLSDHLDYIANTKFCNDVGYDDAFNYNAYIRIMTNKIPTLNCLGNSFSNDIGLLTIDEAVLAGANNVSYNKDFYLYNSEITDAWYTMTGAKGTENSINMFAIDSSGAIKTDIIGNLYRGVRPVINLIKNIEMEGSGSKEEPYRIAD